MPLETPGYDAPIGYDSPVLYDGSGTSTVSGAARATDGVSANYKFFTADLLTNAVLAEIPFKNVSYGRAIKNSGPFSGDIPVIPDTASMDLYNSTMPGKTALYVVRDNECMWGGIIWSREYNVIDKTLKVSGLEFPSYLHHRMVWKTYTHDFGADFVVSGGTISATLQNLTYQFVVGSSIRVSFPTTDMFEYNGYYTIATAVDDTHFTVTGTSIPNGSFTDVTVYARVDTYDYVRQLLDEISVDFAYSSFANSDLQPMLVDDIVAVSKQVTSNVATIVTNTPHGALPSQMITVLNVDPALDGVAQVTSVPTATSLTFSVVTADQSLTAVSQNTKVVTTKSITNYVGEVTTSTAHGYATGDVVTIAGADGVTKAVSFKQVIAGMVTITTSTPHGANASDFITLAGVDGVLDGAYYLESVPSDTTMLFTVATPDIVKTAVVAGTVVIAKTIPTFDGEFTITYVSPTKFSIVLADSDMATTTVAGATATRYPTVQVASYGPFPGNADIGLDFSTLEYSGQNVLTTNHRGYELVNVGEELDKYSDTVYGFEYRVDCAIAYAGEVPYFTRTFVLIPIDFPDPPAEGEVSLPSRFGADRLVFEYPGNIVDVSMTESAENAATRFFVVGSTEDGVGAEAAEPYSAASALDLLAQGWPILEQQESRTEVDDRELLYQHAGRYLSESRPPIADITIKLNGSLSPKINEYVPGDWCSIIINDPFIKMRLASNLEVRSDVIVRKIDNYTVTVPDSPSFPEDVSITLITEALVDKIGE